MLRVTNGHTQARIFLLHRGSTPTIVLAHALSATADRIRGLRLDGNPLPQAFAAVYWLHTRDSDCHCG